MSEKRKRNEDDVEKTKEEPKKAKVIGNILCQKLANTTAKELIPWMKDKLITVQSTDSFISALQTLIENKILGAPILEEASGQCIGKFETNKMDVCQAFFKFMEKRREISHLFFANSPIRIC